MFLWYLSKRSKSDEEREGRFFEQLDKQTKYLQGRDAQSKEIAMSGHDALRSLAREVEKLTIRVGPGGG